MVSRVSTLVLHQQNLLNMSTRMADLNALNKQISSGKRAETFADIPDGVSRVISYQSKINNINNYLTNNKAALTRLDTINTSVKAVQNIASDFRSMLVQWKSDGNERGSAFVQQAQGYLDQIAGQLNIKVEGRYLFGGTRTDTAPVTQPIPDPETFGGLDDSYYQGDNNDLNVRVSDTFEINYGARANEQGFQQIIAAIKTAIDADSINNVSGFNNALDMANAAIDSLTSIAARINSNIITIGDINTQHTDVQIYIKNALSDEVDTDITGATIKLSLHQTVLQATYAAFARISSLKLTDFLN